MNRQQMNAPFAEEEIRTFEKTWKDKSGRERSISLTYIEDETVMDRLDVGYGPGNWQIQVEPVGGTDHAVKVRLGVRELGDWVWYEDFGYPNREGGEVLKEAVSDGIRRCGRYVGIARDLYRKATYEPGGLLSRSPRPEQPADIPPTDPADETLRPLGPIERVGAIAKGTGRHSDLEWRRTPDEGYRVGFLLEVGDGKAKPQVVVEGPLAFALYAAEAELLGLKVAVKGDLFEVHVPKRRTIYRINATSLETDEWTLPATVAEAMPEPLGLVEDDLSDLPGEWVANEASDAGSRR